MARIYAADDEKDIRDIIEMFLANEGYEVVTFSSGDALYEAFEQQSCDLVLLDIMMPGTDGLTICNKLRRISSVPIILLTAKDTDSDYIAGLTLGSDDYMTKPFRPTILIAKIKALLRRVELELSKQPHQIKEESAGSLACGDLSYNKKAHALRCNNQEVKLTATELRFLLYLMERQDEAVSKDEILDKIWGYTAEVETRVADETNRRLRKKLTQAGSRMYVQTVWGYGFKFTDKEKPS